MKGRLTSGEEKWAFEVPRVILGRGASSHIQVTDAGASRHHAELWINYAMKYMVLDSGSRNGTFLNDQTLYGPALLRDGDIIRIGDQEFAFTGNMGSDGLGAVPEGAPEFKVLMMAVRLREDAAALKDEPIVRSCALGQWFLKKQDTVAKHLGYINHIDKNLVFAYWSAQELPLRDVLKKATACAKEVLQQTKALDDELKMAITVEGNKPIITATVALHAGTVIGRPAGSEGAEFYIMAGDEIENCLEIAEKLEPSFDSVVCTEVIASQAGGMSVQPVGVTSIGSAQEGFLLHRLKL